jgi:uncharacterized protein YqgV (UPF0045/DUF77 family)
MDKLCAEVALYPLKTNNASGVINYSLDSINNMNLDVKVGSINTHIHGNDSEVWQGIRSLFESAKENGEISMVLTITNAADTEHPR